MGAGVPRPFRQVARPEGVDGKGLVHFFLARVHRRKRASIDDEVGLPFPAYLEHPLAVGDVELIVGQGEDVVVRGGPQQFDDLPADLALGTGYEHPHLRCSHHQRLSRYQPKVALSASSRSRSGRQPIARIFSELTL